MKKVLLPVSLAVLVLLAAVAGWVIFNRDRERPEIKISKTKEEVYRSGMTKEELLKGVTATDDRDGDVTESLMVESVKVSEENDYVTVTYVAVDKSKNVTRKSWNMKFAGEDAPEETPAAEEESASAQDSQETEPEEEQSAAETVQQDPEEVAIAEQEDRIAKLSPQAPRFYLKQHTLTVPLGGEFNKLDWVDEITDDKDDRSRLFRDIRVEGDVDVSVAGTYSLTYFAVDSDGNRSNEEILTVTVTP